MRVKTDAKRQAILQAAGEVFRERGFGGASMSQVAERVGGSKATLYRYFTSKEELFLATMLDAAIDTAKEVFEGLRPDRDLRRTLETFGADYLALTVSAGNLAVRRILIAEGQRSGAGQRLFERGPKVVWGRMADFLEGRMAAGQLRGHDPWAAAMHLRGLLEADIVNRALIGADIDARPSRLRRLAAEAVDVMLRAYAAPEGSAEGGA